MWTQRKASWEHVRIPSLLHGSSLGRYLQISESYGHALRFLNSLRDSTKSHHAFRAVGKECNRASYFEQESSFPDYNSRFSSSHEASRSIDSLLSQGSDLQPFIRSTLYSSHVGQFPTYRPCNKSSSSIRHFVTASSRVEDQSLPAETRDGEPVTSSVVRASETWHTKLSAILATGRLPANGKRSANGMASPARISKASPEQNRRPSRILSPFSLCHRLRTERDIDVAWRYFLWAEKEQGYKHGVEIYNTMIQSLCGAKRFSTVLDLLETMRADGLFLTPTTCVKIIKSLASENMYGKAMDFFRNLELYGWKLNVAVYNSYLEVLVKAGHYNLIEETFCAMVHRSISPNIYSYNSLLSGFRWAGQPEMALRYFYEMKQKGCKPNAVTYATVLRSLGMVGRKDEVLELFCEMGRKELVPTRVTYTTLLDIFREDATFTMNRKSPWVTEAHDHRRLVWTLCRRKDFDFALITLREMETEGHKIPLAIYNLFAVFLRDAGKFDSVLELFRRMKARGCEPDAVTYTVAIGAAYSSRRAPEALSLHKEMVQKGHALGVGTWNMLIAVASKTGQVGVAVELFSEMRKTCKPDAYTFNTLISILCSLENKEDAQTFLRKLGIRADAINSCEQGALELFRFMERIIAPDSVTYQTLIHAMCRSGRLQDCQDLVQEMEERGFRAGLVLYHRILQLLGHAGKVDKAWKLFLKMRTSNMPEGMTYAMIIKILAKGGRFGKATKLLEEMEMKGFAPSAFEYTPLIESLARAKRFQEADKLMKQMAKKGCRPDRMGYNSLIDTYCTAGKVAQAYRIFLKSVDDGCLPGTITYNSLIRGYFRFSNTNDALDMYDVMKKMGSKPNGDTLNILINGLNSAGRKDELKQILEEMHQLGVVSSAESADTDVPHVEQRKQEK
ncbi:hypothetical protein R1flu_012528 [Riccia fluitans]|uniref:Pentatricopeptide repeat-containing protein n=1 Tax=Riccia fluitans TaxID=41844 RepID=A0ABD1ZB70_9MARC